jgi:tRNA 2-thiouridine synthesizing protein B
MTLHTWNKARTSHPSFELCRTSMAPGDALLLLEDGVYSALELAFVQLLQGSEQDSAYPCYALAADLAARGISAKIPNSVNVVDYMDFVALCLQHDRVVNWA